jgi:ComF family protein
MTQLAWILCRQLQSFYGHTRSLKQNGLEPEWQEMLDRILPLPPVIKQENLILVPVPLHPRRLRYRGFNQSRQLTLSLTGHYPGLQFREDLVRTRYSRPQAKLKRKQRQKNLRNAFKWEGPRLDKRIVLLVDDVASTGTTLKECAQPLKKAGAEVVWALVLAQG